TRYKSSEHSDEQHNDNIYNIHYLLFTNKLTASLMISCESSLLSSAELTHSIKFSLIIIPINLCNELFKALSCVITSLQCLSSSIIFTTPFNCPCTLLIRLIMFLS